MHISSASFDCFEVTDSPQDWRPWHSDFPIHYILACISSLHWIKLSLSHTALVPSVLPLCFNAKHPAPLQHWLLHRPNSTCPHHHCALLPPSRPPQQCKPASLPPRKPTSTQAPPASLQPLLPNNLKSGKNNRRSHFAHSDFLIFQLEPSDDCLKAPPSSQGHVSLTAVTPVRRCLIAAVNSFVTK